MEAQKLSFGLSSTLSTSPIQNRKNPIFKIPSFSYTSPNNLTLKGFFLKPHFSFSPKVLPLPTKKIFQCTNCLQGIEKEFVTIPNNCVSKELKKKKLAVFVSGGGSNFRSIYEATIEGTVHGEVAVLVTNKLDCGGAKYAREQGIPVILFPKAKDTSEGLSEEDLVGALRTYNIDFILLAGYLKLIPTELVQAFPRSIFNIHPSLLPAFGGKGYYGMKVHKAVIASGARYSGPTIHYVDEHYDTGRILAQRVVPVLANDTADTLAARVLQEEHKLYVEVAAALCEERIVWRQDGVPLIQSKEDPNHYK
ncbi:phosphoribosylglycinamide formyltransferase, chloroplastic [Nicotiana tabacum]|uniref:Phosphoribosylglycinamide formyltransferase, chloroplastic n=2 Tax=Nicotiana TaxID=4085 RepID=A0A1S4B0Q7_TOBAC|nr:PREDICTED: phosphoribosylglycinamide formyltransferase, chloroplastic [Nicotiana sylvestris]XP_016482424.1 PREDICTED: phosphoribosylglycinamide formyltransferase, chloroplastic-like [Nicotiana tabacum]